MIALWLVREFVDVVTDINGLHIVLLWNADEFSTFLISVQMYCEEMDLRVRVGPFVRAANDMKICYMRHMIMSRSETSTRPLLDTIILTLTTYRTEEKSEHKKRIALRVLPN